MRNMRNRRRSAQDLRIPVIGPESIDRRHRHEAGKMAPCGRGDQHQCSSRTAVTCPNPRKCERGLIHKIDNYRAS